MKNFSWDKMAKKYPHYDDIAMSKDVNYVIDWVEERGVSFANSTVLDIGCGTGTIAIPLVFKGAKVTGVDISGEMLNQLSYDMDKLNINDSITVHQSEWEDFSLISSYDIIIASMTPALSKTELIDKMLAGTANIGIYVGWGKYKNNLFLTALFDAHNFQSSGKPQGSCIKTKEFLAYLEEKGLTTQHEYFDTSWSDFYTKEEALEYAYDQLEYREIAPKKDVIDSVIREFTQGESVVIETQTEKGVVLFSREK
jgi:SAM-dependent methyltransferase